MDLKSVFHQIKFVQKDREKSAFSVNKGSTSFVEYYLS